MHGSGLFRFNESLDMSQLESMLEHTSPANLLRQDDMAASAGAASAEAAAAAADSNAGAAFAAAVQLAIHGVRCDVTPSASQLIALLNLSDRLIAARRYRDAAESGMFFVGFPDCIELNMCISLSSTGESILYEVSEVMHCFLLRFLECRFALRASTSPVSKFRPERGNVSSRQVSFGVCRLSSALCRWR